MSAELRNLAIVLLVMLSIPVGAVIGGRMALDEYDAYREPERGVLMDMYWTAFWIGEGIRCDPRNKLSDHLGCPGPPGSPR